MNPVIIEETDKMIDTFMQEFFIPYAKKIDHYPDFGNIIISFIQSTSLNVLFSVLSHIPEQKYKLQTANEIIDILKENLIKQLKQKSLVVSH